MDRDSLILGALQAGRIEVDLNTGKIYSLCIRGKKGQKIELTGATVNGYRCHEIYFMGTKKQVRGHRVIWMAAHGPIPAGLIVDHINRDRQDNRLCNLRLVDAKGNALNSPNKSGEENANAKLTRDQVEEIRELHRNGKIPYKGRRRLAKKYGVSIGAIDHVITGRSWKEVNG